LKRCHELAIVKMRFIKHCTLVKSKFLNSVLAFLLESKDKNVQNLSKIQKKRKEWRKTMI